MRELTQIVRRHGKTMKGPDGKKLDKPTPEAIKKAYQEGHDLGQQYPDHKIYGAHSKKARTRATVTAYLIGADVDPQGRVHEEPELNAFKVAEEEREQIRNMPDPTEQYTFLFTELNDSMQEAGYRIARYLVQSAADDTVSECTPIPALAILGTHGGGIDAARLILEGKDVTIDKVLEAGIIDAGKGFDLAVRKEGNIYVAELAAGGKPNQYELGELMDRLDVQPREDEGPF